MEDREILWMLLFFLGLFLPFDDASSQLHSEIPTSNEVIHGGSTKFVVAKYFEIHRNFEDSSYQRYLATLTACERPSHLPSVSVLRRQLRGEGYHRDLFSTFKIVGWSQLCKAILIEKLPYSIFADSFELKRLLQYDEFKDVAVMGDTNLELPAFLSNRSLVEIHLNVDRRPIAVEKEIDIRLPLHARYPPLVENGYFDTKFESPDLLMLCGDGQEEEILCGLELQDVQTHEQPLWKIPSGRTAHSSFVSCATFIAAFVSTFAIVVVSLQHYRNRNC